MKTSLFAAANLAANPGRNAERAGKFGMDTLMRQSFLSMLQPSQVRSIARVEHPGREASTRGTTSNEAFCLDSDRQAIQPRKPWRYDSKSKVAVRVPNVAKLSRDCRLPHSYTVA